MPETSSHRQPPVPLLVCYLALVAWLPLPLGSNRTWAWALLLFGLAILAAGWLLLWGRARIAPPSTLAKAWPVTALLLLWSAWLGCQLLPLPDAWLAALSPAAAGLRAAATAAAEPGAHALGHSFHPLSLDPWATANQLVKSLVYLGFFIFALLLVTTRKALRWLAITLLMAGLFQAGYGSLMTLSGIEYGFFHPKAHNLGLATGTFVNRNHLAGYLELTLAGGIGLLIADLGGPSATHWRARIRNLLALILSRKALVRLALVIMVTGLVLTRSRLGNTAFFVGLLLAGALALVQSRHATRQTVILLASLVVIDLLLVGAWFGVDRVIDRLRGTEVVVLDQPAATRSDGSLDERQAVTPGDDPGVNDAPARRVHLLGEDRDEITASAWQLAKQFPLVGSGAGSYYGLYGLTRSGALATWYDHVHNDYLETLLETGPLGLGLLGLAVALSLWQALAAQQRRRDPLMRGMAFAAIMGIASLLIHASGDFNHQIPANAATFVVLLAMAWLANQLERRRNGTNEPS